MTKEGMAAIREAGHIPYVARGKKTEWLFKRFEIESNGMAVCVRGFGRRFFGLSPSN